MDQKVTLWMTASLLVTVGFLSRRSVAADDGALGCFKEDPNNRYFNVSAGNYVYKRSFPRNSSSGECIQACSALNNGSKLAGLTIENICLCSSALTSSLQFNDTLCNYGYTDGLYIVVYPIMSLANISIPGSVMILQEFSVYIDTVADPSCSYLLDFNDGRRVIVTRNTSITHIYKSAGTFTMTLSSNPLCLPEVITKIIEVRPAFGNVSLDCPDVIEATETNSYCKLLVLQGSHMNVTLNSDFLGTVSDNVIQSLGMTQSQFYNGPPSPSSSRYEIGTYLFPLESAVHDGHIAAFEVYLYRPGTFKIQVFSPKCLTNKISCFADCVAPDVPCGGPAVSGCSSQEEMCFTLGRCNSTSNSKNATSSPQRNLTSMHYLLHSEFSINITTQGYSLHLLSSPHPIQRGDIIGWYSSRSSAGVEFTYSSFPSTFLYSNEEFTVGQSKSLSINESYRTYYFRVHLQTSSAFEIALTPLIPHVDVNVNVSSGTLERHEVLSRTVLVQERISGLRFVSPNISKTKYFSTNKEIVFMFQVTNGSKVRYLFDAGDGSNLKSSSTGNFTHSYKRGRYTLNVTAFNKINNVSLEETLTLVNDIGNLSFTRDPRDNPGEIGIPYTVKFQLGAGDGVRFAVDFGRNDTLLIMCSNLTNQEFSANYRYPEVGIYNITVYGYSKYLNMHLNITSSVEIMEKISNLTLFEIKNGKDIPLEQIHNHPYSLPLKIRVRISSGSSVTFQSNVSGAITNGEKQKNSSHEAVFKFEFKSSGVQVIIVTARNGISEEDRTFRVKPIKACENCVSFYDKRDEGNPLQTTRAVKLRFSVEEQRTTEGVVCNSSSCWEYAWTLFMNERNGGYKLKGTLNNTASQDTLFIPKGTLKSGVYKLRVNASCNDPRQFNKHSVSETFFIIEKTQLVPLILGGSRRDVAYNGKGTLVLDASSSYDPDEKHFNSEGLIFNWTCSSNRSLVFQRNSSLAEIEMEDLMRGRYYIFEVTVGTFNNRSAVGEQWVRLINKSIPTTEIKCKVNCLPLVVTTERLSLEGHCENCGNESDIIFTWLLEKEEEGNWSRYPLTNKHTFTKGTGSNIVIKPDVLKNNKTYRLLLKARRDKNAGESLSAYTFTTSNVPTAGHCNIRPSSGIAADTKFQVSCLGWKATYYPLTYSIRYQSSFRQNANVSSVRKDDQIWILWYYGLEQTSPLSILPSGLNVNDSYLAVNVKIQDNYGAYTTFTMSVRVTKPQIVNTEIFKNALAELGNIDAESHPQKFTQLVTIYSTILNEDHSKNISQIKKIRLDLVQMLSQVKPDTLPLIKQIADAVKLATYDYTQVVHKTQKIAADIVKKMSDTLVEIASDPTTCSGQVIDETARNLLSCLCKVLDASFHTGVDITKSDAPEEVKYNLYGTVSKKGSELQKIGRETQEVVSNIIWVIQDISLAILKNKVIGEESTVTETDNFDMILDYTLLEDIYKVTKHIAWTSGQFILPQDEMPFSKKNYSQLYTEFIAFKRNPFSWDIERSPFIQPRVLSLSFRTEKNATVPVRNISKDIEIFLVNEKQNINRVLESSTDDPDLLVHNFKVTQSDSMETLVLDILHSSGSRWLTGARFFIRFGGQVSQSDFDFSHQFSNCTSCEGHSIDMNDTTILVHEFEKLERSGGQVSVGVLPCGLRSCNSSSERFMVYVTSVSCRFWDKSQWKTDGCRVGPKTTPWQTHCLCNHLTSFGSYIVKPNPLTKFSIEDFKQGYVIFVTVATIFLLYILILVWARKADRAEISKGGFSVLPDNNPEDMYRYEIAIWTGMRRNAGTESDVTVILSGDLEDTEPRHLVIPNKNGFQRGSLEKFLLTTPEDIGSLYCIRIWHDNSKGSWYLSRVMVTDLEKDEQYYFISDRWLAVDEDDGAIERLLPVASDEELTEFQRLFLSRTKRNFSDSHLWISVLNRPSHSQFTRIQRLSCCLCLLMIAMVTNAMFYNARSEPKPNSTNFIGSYSFTWDEVFIGIASSLIIFPVNIIILYIFRHVRPKPSKSRRSSSFSLTRLSPDYKCIRASPSVTTSVITTASTVWSSEGDEQIRSVPVPKIALVMKRMKRKKKKIEEVTFWFRFKKFLPRLPSSLPHCFVYFAWFFLVILTLCSAAVLILYGMEFGNGRSLQWLFSILVSICEDIFVLQPLKVLVLALIFALLVKKPDEGEFKVHAADDDALKVDEELLTTSPSPVDSSTRTHSSRLATRPDEGQVKMMREARLKERKMFVLIQEIIVHLLFSIVIVLVTYGHKDSRAIYLFRHLDQFSDKTEEIRNFSVFWNWSQTVLIPNAFPEKLYNLQDVPSYGFFDDRYNNLISRARLRLLRVKHEDSCTIADELKQSMNFCAKDYSISEQDEACYDEKWTKSNCTDTNTTPWSFQNRRQLDGYPYWGRFKIYSGSGYITELTPGNNNSKTANEMKKLRWLERHSRALFVEFTVYNANVNLFSSMLLLFEFPSFGGVYFRRDIRPMRLQVYVGGFAFFIFACEVIFSLFIVVYLYLALKKIYHNGVVYFKEFWNLIDFAIIAVSIAAIGVYIYRIDLTTKLMKRVSNLDGTFVNFQYASYWNEVFDCLVATVVCLTTIKLTKLMRFNMRISLFSLTLKRARPALFAFTIQFGIVFFAYVIVGVLVFGHNVAQFKSITSSILSLGCQILGKNQFTELSRIDPVVGPAFFVTFVLFVCWILVNMFIAILNDAYHQVQLDCGEMTNEYEVMEFFLTRFRAWSGLVNTKVPKLSPSVRWQKAGAKMTAVNKFRRHRRIYQPSAENVALEKTADLMETLEDSVATLERRINILQTLDDQEHLCDMKGTLWN